MGQLQKRERKSWDGIEQVHTCCIDENSCASQVHYCGLVSAKVCFCLLLKDAISRWMAGTLTSDEGTFGSLVDWLSARKTKYKELQDEALPTFIRMTAQRENTQGPEAELFGGGSWLGPQVPGPGGLSEGCPRAGAYTVSRYGFTRAGMARCKSRRTTG